MTKGMYLLSEGAFEKIYGPSERKDVEQLLGHQPPHYESQRVEAEPDLLKDVEVVLGGWGTPPSTAGFWRRPRSSGRSFTAPAPSAAWSATRSGIGESGSPAPRRPTGSLWQNTRWAPS